LSAWPNPIGGRGVPDGPALLATPRPGHMVKFGKRIESEKLLEWSEGYMDYKGLKKILNQMIATGRVKEFSEFQLYAAISVATSDHALKPSGPTEADFMSLVDAEIERVNKFSLRLHAQLDDQVAAVREGHESWIKGGQQPGEVEAIRRSIDGCERAVHQFEDFLNLNYLAFSKILKKHDKCSSCPFRMPYLMRIQSETMSQHKMTDIIKALSEINASISGAASVAGAGVFDANQKGGASFIRKTSKYWVETRNVLRVKMFLLKHLPVYKFTDGSSDADLVTSIYFDNDAYYLYDGRLKKHDGAIAFRIRWYGEEPPRTAFLERKTHHEDWYGDGEASAKERFPLPDAKIVPFLEGRLSPEQVGEILTARNFKGDVGEAVQLAREIQAVVLQRRLRPSVRTHYMRTAFQKTGDATVRCSLDTELCMALERCASDRWRREGSLQSLHEVTQFPHAVLEIKLQLAQGTTPPEWVTELLESGTLREMPKFSKFVHGTAFLNSTVIKELPYWYAPEMMPLWANATLMLSPPKVKPPGPSPKSVIDRRAPLKFSTGLHGHPSSDSDGDAHLDGPTPWHAVLAEVLERIATCRWFAAPGTPRVERTPAGAGVM